jgi:hypothetical protein
MNFSHYPDNFLKFEATLRSLPATMLLLGNSSDLCYNEYQSHINSRRFTISQLLCTIRRRLNVATERKRHRIATWCLVTCLAAKRHLLRAATRIHLNATQVHAFNKNQCSSCTQPGPQKDANTLCLQGAAGL